MPWLKPCSILSQLRTRPTRAFWCVQALGILKGSFGCAVGWEGLIYSKERSEKRAMSVDKSGSSTTLNQMSGKSPSVQLLWPENHRLKLDSYINHVTERPGQDNQFSPSPRHKAVSWGHLEKSIHMQNQNTVLRKLTQLFKLAHNLNWV